MNFERNSFKKQSIAAKVLLPLQSRQKKWAISRIMGQLKIKWTPYHWIDTEIWPIIFAQPNMHDECIIFLRTLLWEGVDPIFLWFHIKGWWIFPFPLLFSFFCAVHRPQMNTLQSGTKEKSKHHRLQRRRQNFWTKRVKKFKFFRCAPNISYYYYIIIIKSIILNDVRVCEKNYQGTWNIYISLHVNV